MIHRTASECDLEDQRKLIEAVAKEDLTALRNTLDQKCEKCKHELREAVSVSLSNGKYDALEILLERGGNDLRKFALVRAAERGNLPMLDHLLRSDMRGDIRGAMGDHTYNATWKAAYKGHVHVVKTLIDAGQDVTRFDGNFLRRLRKKGHHEVVNALLEAGATKYDRERDAKYAEQNKLLYEAMDWLRKRITVR